MVTLVVLGHVQLVLFVLSNICISYLSRWSLLALLTFLVFPNVVFLTKPILLVEMIKIMMIMIRMMMTMIMMTMIMMTMIMMTMMMMIGGGAAVSLYQKWKPRGRRIKSFAPRSVQWFYPS